MDMTKIVGYKNRPAVIISKSSSELPTFVAIVLYLIEKDNVQMARIDTVYDQDQITDYYCPHANEDNYPLAHCSNEGKCMYPATLTDISTMCLACKAESMAEFLYREEFKHKNTGGN